MSSPYRESPPPRRGCPRCGTPLEVRPIGDEAIEECGRCQGVFVRQGLVPRLMDALDLGGEVLQTFARGEPVAVRAGPLYLPCPVCGVLMNRKLFATGARVIIDMCRVHGIWFDEAELRAVVEFAAGGGLERAAEADARRRAEEERAARVREVLRTPFQPPAGPDREGRLIEILLALFR